MEKNIKVNCSGWFVGVLTLIFITLKLLGKITWSWVWVLSPLWISGLLGIAICLLAVFWFKRHL